MLSHTRGSSSPIAQRTRTGPGERAPDGLPVPNSKASRRQVLSRPSENGRRFGLSLVVETGDGIRDGAGESVGVSKGAVGELMLFEVAPASFDVIQLGGVFGQPLDGEPGALGKRAGCQLAGVDRPVIENRDQGPGAFGGAVGGTELIEQGDEVGRTLGGAGVHEQAPA